MVKKDSTKPRKLTLKQELFCKYYLFGSEEPKLDRGNGTRSYMLAYGKGEEDYDVCGNEASVTLKKPGIIAYQKQLLEREGFNDNFVDGMLLKKVKEGDMQAIKEYNNLKVRIEKARQTALNDDEITKDVINNINIT